MSKDKIFGCLSQFSVSAIRPSSMSASKRNHSDRDQRVYSEFGDRQTQSAMARPEPPVSQQTLKVQASRKGRKGKTVTVISGFQAKPETLTELSKKLKAQCGAGGTVKDQEIEIQGDHRQQVVQFLDQLGYPVKISGG
jgi:translation initiation factor 1